MTGQVLPGSPSISRAATTTCDRDQRADGEVELAGDDHEVLAGGEDDERRGALEERQERPAARGSRVDGSRSSTSSTTSTRKIGAVPISALRSRSPRLLAASRRSRPSRSLIRASRSAAGVDGDRGDDDHAAHDVLEERVDLELVERWCRARRGADAADRAEHAAAAAGERRAAEHHRGDRLQVVAAVRCRRSGRPTPSRLARNRPASTGAERADDVRGDDRCGACARRRAAATSSSPPTAYRR